MSQYKVVLVDDESSSNIVLERMLQRYVPNAKVVGVANSVAQAVEVIDKTEPDLVFLDISMPDGDGFEVVEKTNFKNYYVIFVTAYDQYALKAFDIGAIHYLLKPIIVEDLLEAIERFEKITLRPTEEHYKIVGDIYHNTISKIILPTSNAVYIVDLDDIYRCESSNNYTTFFLKDGSKIIVSKPIHLYEEILPKPYFCRIHNKHIVNLKYVKKYIKGRGGKVVLADASEVDVSESRKDELIENLKKLSI